VVVRLRPGRLVVGLLTAGALIAILVGVTGFELPWPRLGTGNTQRPPLPGVRAIAASTLLRVGSGAPPGGELAFLAVEPSGNLFVSDSRRHTLMRFDPSGHLLSEWGPRFGDVILDQPAGVAVQGDNFYVLDRGTPRIFRLDAAGRLQATLSLESLGTYGLNGLTTDLAGNVYAADTGRNRILAFSPTGQLLRQVGRGGTDLGGLTQPWMLAFAPDGSFFVADWENSRVQRWNTSFEATDAWPTGFHPSSVAVDPIGRLFVPDTERRRIEVYSAQGVVLGEMGVPGSPLLDVAPRQVAVGRADRLSVYALGGDGIVRLDLENIAAPPPGGAAVEGVSLAVLGLLVAVLVFAVLSRRARRASLAGSLGAALDRPVRLDAKNGAEPDHQQPRADENFLIAHQTEREQ
jgi:DNA-binding beta-propeller fold protein YncE